MQQLLINLFGWNSQGNIIHYPDGRLFISHTVVPDKQYSFNEVFMDNIQNTLHT